MSLVKVFVGLETEIYLSVSTDFDAVISILLGRYGPMNQEGINMVCLKQPQRPLQAPFHILRRVKMVPYFCADKDVGSGHCGIGSQELLDTGSNLCFVIITVHINISLCCYFYQGVRAMVVELWWSYNAAQSR